MKIWFSTKDASIVLKVSLLAGSIAAVARSFDEMRRQLEDKERELGDIAERIFEPMFTTKDIGSGTGLGLSISSDIVLKHNGLFYIDKQSKNTRFVLELPIVHIAK